MLFYHFTPLFYLRPDGTSGAVEVAALPPLTRGETLGGGFRIPWYGLRPTAIRQSRPMTIARGSVSSFRVGTAGCNNSYRGQKRTWTLSKRSRASSQPAVFARPRPSVAFLIGGSIAAKSHPRCSGQSTFWKVSRGGPSGSASSAAVGYRRASLRLW